MKLKRSILFLLSIFILYSCQEEDVTNWDTDNENKSISFAVTSEEAINESLKILAEMYPQTKTVNKNAVSSVYAWRSSSLYSQTRSSQESIQLPDTMLYIVNFANNGGYALVSADKRVDGIIAIIDEGSLSPFDEITNPGFRMYLEDVKKYFVKEITASEVNTKSITSEIDTVYSDWRVLDIWYPLLKTKWSQGAPFNKYCFTDDGQQAIAGCVAIAIGQIMSSHRYPQSYKGYSYNWDSILSGKIKPISEKGCLDVARLVADIGKLVEMKYGIFSSTAVSTKTELCLKAMDYHYSYSNSFIIERCFGNFRYSNSPVYISAAASNSLIGHAWVLDGAALRGRTMYCYDRAGNLLSTKDSERQFLIHCNWGWGGSNNGYFLKNVFDTAQKQADDDLRTRTHYSERYNLYYDVYPNK